MSATTHVLAGKSALVTGGSRGIGAAIAARLAAEGAAVTLTYIGDRAPAEEVVRGILDRGGAARAVHADASAPGESAAAVASTVAEQGGLDILVSNAGINRIRALPDITDADYEAVFGVNVRGSLEVIRAAAGVMAPGARIIVISATIANSFFSPGLGLYGASKAALNAFVQGWARDLGPKGITINAVVPGPIDTDMNPGDGDLADWLKGRVPLARYGTAAEVAALTSFLAGPEAGFITGARMVIDGGLTC